MTPLVDDLNDEVNWSFQDIEKALQENQTEDDSIALLKLFLGKLHKPLPEKYSFYLEKLKIAQNQSMQQVHKTPLDFSALLNLTSEKGAYSFLLYRSILQAPVSLKEEKCLAQIGYILQLTNDLFDVYKDVQSGTQTPVTHCGDLNRFAHVFHEEIDNLTIYLKEAAPSNSVYESYLLYLSTILGRAYVCLEQLQQLTTHNNGIFQPEIHPRKVLICDMERPRNLWKSYQFSSRIVQTALSNN
jgi:hypothetical protein